MDTTTPTLSHPQHTRVRSHRSAGRNVRVRSTARAPKPLAEEPPVRVLVVFESWYRSYGDAIAAAVQRLRPRAEVTISTPPSLLVEMTRSTPHLVISSQSNVLDTAHATVWVRLPHEPGLAGEICFGDQCVEAHDVGLDDLLAIFDEIENRIRA